MGQPDQQCRADALDGDQVHLLGGLQMLAAHHIGEQIGVQRLALRQAVDHQSEFGRELVQLIAHQVAHALRNGHTAVPDPHPSYRPEVAGGDLVLDQLLQEQRVATGQLPEALCAARIHRTVEDGLRPWSASTRPTAAPDRAGPAGRLSRAL